MLPPAAPAAAPQVIPSGYIQAVSTALSAPAITAVACFLTRKRLAWETSFDMPVGLDTLHWGETGTPFELFLGDPGLRYTYPGADSIQQGWIVLLGITNPGWAPIRSRDFRTPLTFAFPGRQVHSTRILPEPSRRAARQAVRAAAIRLSVDSAQSGGGASRPARIHLTGDYVLRPDDSYTVMLLLSGTPAGPTPIQQEGSLTSGKIIQRLGSPECAGTAASR